MHTFMARFDSGTWSRLANALTALSDTPVYGTFSPTPNAAITSAVVRECERLELEFNRGRRFKRGQDVPMGRPRKL